MWIAIVLLRCKVEVTLIITAMQLDRATVVAIVLARFIACVLMMMYDAVMAVKGT